MPLCLFPGPTASNEYEKFVWPSFSFFDLEFRGESVIGRKILALDQATLGCLSKDDNDAEDDA